jgi:hypothetical protein
MDCGSPLPLFGAVKGLAHSAVRVYRHEKRQRAAAVDNTPRNDGPISACLDVLVAKGQCTADPNQSGNSKHPPTGVRKRKTEEQVRRPIT